MSAMKTKTLRILLGTLDVRRRAPDRAQSAVHHAHPASHRAPDERHHAVLDRRINANALYQFRHWDCRRQGTVPRQRRHDRNERTWPGHGQRSSSGGASATATCITQTPNGSLSNEQALSTLATALIRNTTTTGVLVAHGGTSVAESDLREHQCGRRGDMYRSRSHNHGSDGCPFGDAWRDWPDHGHAGRHPLRLGAGYDLCPREEHERDALSLEHRHGEHSGLGSGQRGQRRHGNAPVGNGGIGIATGTSGGILGFTAPGTLASSVVLTANRIVLGGGAGATPTVAQEPWHRHNGPARECRRRPVLRPRGSLDRRHREHRRRCRGTGLSSYTIGDLILRLRGDDALEVDRRHGWIVPALWRSRDSPGMVHDEVAEQRNHRRRALCFRS